MKRIAIFSSGAGTHTSELAGALENDPRFHIDIIFTDGGPEAADLLRTTGIPVNGITADSLALQQETLAQRLADNGIDIIATDSFSLPVPPAISGRWENRILHLDACRPGAAADGSDVETASGAYVEALERLTDEPPLPPKSVDEEWAETLRLNFDPAAVPPPIPPIQENEPAQNAIPGGTPSGEDNDFYLQQYAGEGNRHTSPGMQPDNNTPRPPMPENYLLWSILATVLCCFIPGIVAIIFSSQVSSRYYTGDYDGARRASRNAQICIIASIVLGVVSAALYIPISLL